MSIINSISDSITGLFKIQIFYNPQNIYRTFFFFLKTISLLDFAPQVIFHTKNSPCIIKM